MTCDDLCTCCENEDCKKFIKDNFDAACKAKGCPTPMMSSGGDFLTLVLQVLPVLIDLFKKWRATNPA